MEVELCLVQPAPNRQEMWSGNAEQLLHTHTASQLVEIVTVQAAHCNSVKLTSFSMHVLKIN